MPLSKITSPARWNTCRFKDFEPRIELLAQMSAGAALEPVSGIVQSPPDLLKPPFVKLFSANSGLSELTEPFPNPISTAYYRNAEKGWLQLPVIPNLDAASPLAEPVTFYVNILETRQMSVLPRLASSSGIVAFDRAAGAWLSSPEVLGQLPAGYSEVVVYP